MNNEILEVINKNLPNLHAQQLGKILDKAVRDSNEVETLNKKVSTYLEEIKQLKEENSKLEYLKNDLKTIEESKKTLALQKLEFDITKKLLEQKIECEREKRELLSSTLGQIFRTPAVRETVSKNMLATSTSYDYNNRECRNNYTIPVVETKTTEELP